MKEILQDEGWTGYFDPDKQTVEVYWGESDYYRGDAATEADALQQAQEQISEFWSSGMDSPLVDITDLFLEMDGSEPTWMDSLYATWAYGGPLYGWGMFEMQEQEESRGAIASENAAEVIREYLSTYGKPNQSEHSMTRKWGKNLFRIFSSGKENDLTMERFLEEQDLDQPKPLDLGQATCRLIELCMDPSHYHLYPGGLRARWQRRIQRQARKYVERLSSGYYEKRR